MDDHRISQSREISPHDHSTIGSNLRLIGVRHEAVKDGLGLLTGFKKVEIFQCNICGESVEVINPDAIPIKGR